MEDPSGWKPISRPSDNETGLRPNLEHRPNEEVAAQAPVIGVEQPIPLPPVPPDSREPVEDEDPLVTVQREQEEKEKALAEASNIQPYDDEAMQVLFSVGRFCLCTWHASTVFLFQ